MEYLSYAGEDSHWSLLARIIPVGASGTNSLPAAHYGYATSNPPDQLSALGLEIGGLNEPPFVMDNPLVDLLDLNGDGLPDILKTELGGGAHTAYLNRGEILTNNTRVIGWGPAVEVSGDARAWNVNLQSGTEVAHLADMDGDGLADLVYKTLLDEVFYFANQRLTWGSRRAMSVEDFVPPSPFANAAVRTADIDFDKRMDIIQSIDVGGSADYRIWFNLGNQRYSSGVTVPQTTGFLFSQSGVQLADFNGDRVPDVVRVRPENLIVTAGLGYGRFGERVVVALTDGTLDDLQLAEAKLADINGDGLADLVVEQAAPGTLWFWLNLGNYTLSHRKVVTGMPGRMGPNTVIRWADVNGNGSTDLVYADRDTSPRLRTIDLGELMGCATGPNTLLTIHNGIGRVTQIGYAPSTAFALADAAAGSPWPNPMPFPVMVVAAVINLDSLGHQHVTRYRYHDGYYDGVTKQFRGFARVEQVEVGDATAPTLVTRSHFDTGQVHEAMKGRLWRQTAEQEDGRVFWDETTTWTSPPRVLLTGTTGTNVSYVHPTARVKSIRELGQGAEKQLESEFTSTPGVSP